MRAAPEFQVTLRRCGLWRVAVRGLAGAAWAVLLAWVAARNDSAQWAVIGIAAVLAAAVGVLATALARCEPRCLRWDGQCWWLGAATAGSEAMKPRPTRAEPGRLSVAFDLGGWMLLRFDPGHVGWGRRGIWLPVQRRGLEADWHALRCTVHAMPPRVT